MAPIPAELTVTQAADYLKITPEELVFSRARGLPPGRVGYTRGGQLFFRRVDLIPPKPTKKPKPQVEVETEPSTNG